METRICSLGSQRGKKVGARDGRMKALGTGAASDVRPLQRQTWESKPGRGRPDAPSPCQPPGIRPSAAFTGILHPRRCFCCCCCGRLVSFIFSSRPLFRRFARRIPASEFFRDCRKVLSLKLSAKVQSRCLLNWRRRNAF